MIRVAHKIAGIIFRTETNVPLPGLQGEPFNTFSTEEVTPDIVHRHFKIVSDPDVPCNLSEEKQDLLSRFIQLSADQLENPILQSPQLGDRLVTLGRRTDETEIRLEPHYLSICNYSQNSLETYYTEKLGRIVPEQQTYMPEYYLAANFRFIYSSFLPNFSAALLHGSGVIRNGKAALFLAPDNGGKSTVIGHSDDDPILSGDHVILRKEEGVFIAHGTPLGGMPSGPLRAEVGALFMLEKASCFRLDPISARELLYSLWNEHRNYTFFLPKRLRKQAFQLLSEACYNIPRFRMRFSKNFVDWNAIDRVMGKGETH